MSAFRLNIISTGEWPANMLSNFAEAFFVLDDVSCASVEGFIQAIKFDNVVEQERVCSLFGWRAKKEGQKRKGLVKKNNLVWWGGQEIEFRSEEHLVLMERAIRAKFDQCAEARRALLFSCHYDLYHDIGKPEDPDTSLPADDFIRILVKIRSTMTIGGKKGNGML